ncbi:sugar phosphate nucleotidyltransferase, partial [Clostridium perfringens]
TSVPMYSQYGVMSVEDDGRIARFVEKPLIPDYWINAGFMVMEPTIFDDWQGENLEQDIVPKLIARHEAYTYRHQGFFKSFDFYKDVVEM